MSKLLKLGFAPPLDRYGNKLEEGQLVEILANIQGPQMARITNISGAVLPGSEKREYVIEIVLLSLKFEYKPGEKVPGMVRIIDPEAEKLVERALAAE